jgi:hypothetical protein
LRDNCLSSQCRHPTSFEKIYDISEVIEPPKPLKVQLTDNELIIDWDENPAHRSFFLVPWLMSHAYDGNQETQPISENILWDKAWLDANSDDRQTWTN